MKKEFENIRVKYQCAISLKDSESQIQWNRFNAILVVNTILLGLIGLNDTGNKELPTLFKEILQFLPLAGILICTLWFLVTWRGFMWSQFWIKKARELEVDLVGGINPVNEGALRQNKFLRTERAAYLIILIFLFIYILPLSGIKFPISVSINLDLLTFSHIFNNFALGTGALLAGGGGFKLLYEWSLSQKENQRRDKLREELSAKYPPGQHEKNYRLIESDIKPDWVYLHDLKSGKKHHIASMSTLLRLGYARNWSKKVAPNEFNSLVEGDEFLTDGERYS